MVQTAKSIADVVKNGLCIGCGLCEAVTQGRISMQMTHYGSLRPTPANQFTAAEEQQLLNACPGVVVEPRIDQTVKKQDPIWGNFTQMNYAWAANPAIRFQSATGGVLTALGVHLLKTQQIAFILHVAADPASPMRNHWVISETPEQVINASTSRYGPAAPLAGLNIALDRQQPFAIIAKPCDLKTVHQLSNSDPRVDEQCIFRLALVCGGQSRLKKSESLLKEYQIEEEDLTVVRYRGFGNPGKTRIETKDGRAFEKTYAEMWEDESGWELETRCKLCPDALGEAADIAAADVWPGANPSGEDAGINGIIVRTQSGQNLLSSAAEHYDLIVGEAITERQFDDFQPHQVRKKQALQSRFDGLSAANMPIIDAQELRLAELQQQADPDSQQREYEGTLNRAQQGRFTEPLPTENAS